MRIRFKFTKEGYVKFVGHLDTVRLFQRAIKVARLPIAYSQGFNPHAKVYFAMPLSVGVSSTGEYMDMITDKDIDSKDAMETLNKILPEGIKILDAKVVKEGVATLMSLVTTADYRIEFGKNQLTPEEIEGAQTKLKADTLIVMKKGKKKTKEVDIKPLIKSVLIEMQEEAYVFTAKVAAGSMENLSIDLLLKSILDKDLSETVYSVKRLELYTTDEEKEVPLCEFGVEHA